jgi:hypothetical protein
MNLPLDQLKRCTDIDSLRSKLLTLCAPFGTVAQLDIFLAAQAEHRQALCFWHMQSAEEDALLMREWGVGRFGGELVAVVDLDFQKRAEAI